MLVCACQAMHHSEPIIYQPYNSTHHFFFFLSQTEVHSVKTRILISFIVMVNVDFDHIFISVVRQRELFPFLFHHQGRKKFFWFFFLNAWFLFVSMSFNDWWLYIALFIEACMQFLMCEVIQLHVDSVTFITLSFLRCSICCLCAVSLMFISFTVLFSVVFGWQPS